MHILKIFITISIGFTLTGCVTEYSCGQFPTSGCQPVSKVIERTDGEVYDYREDLYRKTHRDTDPEKSNDEASIDRSLRSKTILKPVKPGNPILKKPEVMRVFVPQYVDKNGDLNGSGFIYIKLQDAKWENI